MATLPTGDARRAALTVGRGRGPTPESSARSLPRASLRQCLALLSWLALTTAIPAAAAAEAAVHVVRSGETASGIAARYGCSLAALSHANPRDLAQPDRLRAGARLVIPATCAKGGRVAAPRVTDCGWSKAQIQSGVLKELMRARGFKAPRGFRALVVKTVLTRDQTDIDHQQAWDWGGRASDPAGWNPASTVKLFSAVAALELLHEHGLSVDTEASFHYPRGDRTFTVADLFHRAMHLSKNLPHNRLTQLAGFDRVNGPDGTLQRVGLHDSYVQRAYAWSKWRAEGQPRWLKESPPITLKDGRRVVELPARASTLGKTPCRSSACTSLADLARMMCVMMLHEQLPANRRLRLGGATQGPHLQMLRRAMWDKREGRTDKVWDEIEAVFPRESGYLLFRKAGFSEGWLSENMYIYPKDDRTDRHRWVLAMAAKGGRGALTDAARVIAELIRDGEL